MVFLKRQQSCPMPATATTYSFYSQQQLQQSQSSSWHSLPMGDEDVKRNNANNTNNGNVVFRTHSTTTKRAARVYPESSSPFSFHRVLLPLFYAAGLWSTGVSIHTKRELQASHDHWILERDLWHARQEDSLAMKEQFTQQQQKMELNYKQLLETKNRLGHEARMQEELMERVSGDNQALLLAQLTHHHSPTHVEWMQQRQEALHHKLTLLQQHIQHTSQHQVLEKYGPGPYRVEFKVQQQSQNEEQNEEETTVSSSDSALSAVAAEKKRTKKIARKRSSKKRMNSFVVELGSLEETPHAMETFLDMIHNRLWDNTLFFHHPTQDHVLAAAPVEYDGTATNIFESKLQHFEAVGFAPKEALAFPEYAEHLPHQAYTLGFSGRGPNFYINTIDNSEHHGPGGQQGHHDLAQDADPCFGTIVQGQQVIRDIMTSARKKASIMSPIPKPTTAAAEANDDNGTISDSARAAADGGYDNDDGAGVERPASWQDFHLTRIVQVRLI